MLIDRFNFVKSMGGDFLDIASNANNGEGVDEDLYSTVINANIQESISVIQNYIDQN